MTAPVRDPSGLALRLAGLLIDTIRLAPSQWCRDTVADLAPLLDAATVATSSPSAPILLEEVRHAADRLASALFRRVGDRGSWPVELQLPYDAATAIRRACEANARALLPLIIRDVRFVLERARANPERVDALVQLAYGEGVDRAHD